MAVTNFVAAIFYDRFCLIDFLYYIRKACLLQQRLQQTGFVIYI